jgi:hypothetical protein
MKFTVTTSYYGEQSIIDEYPNIDEAMEAYTDTDWRACHAPKDIGGDIRRITLKHGDNVLRSHAYR